jgi:NAD(P)H-dependent FMN reductase
MFEVAGGDRALCYAASHMPNAPKILAFAGSARSASFNKKLLAVVVGGARAAGAEVTVVDFRDLPLPLYDADLEAQSGFPANVVEFKRLMSAHQGLLIAAPEYNSSITPLLKNAIDWASRPAPGEATFAAFPGKVAGLVSASPGAFGGMRSLITVRAILGNNQVLVIPEQASVGKAHEAFGPDGRLIDPKQQANVERVGARVVKLLEQLAR